jgi:hypothetical protein
MTEKKISTLSLELSLSGLIQGFTVNFEQKFRVSKSKSIWKTCFKGLAVVFLWLDIYWPYRKNKAIKKNAFFLYDFDFETRPSFHKIADFRLPSQLWASKNHKFIFNTVEFEFSIFFVYKTLNKNARNNEVTL